MLVSVRIPELCAAYLYRQPFFTGEEDLEDRFEHPAIFGLKHAVAANDQSVRPTRAMSSLLSGKKAAQRVDIKLMLRKVVMPAPRNQDLLP